MEVTTRNTIQDAAIRTVRTFVQSFLGTFIGLIAAGNYYQSIPDYSAAKSLVIAAAWSALIATITFIWNALEATSNKAVPAK